MRNDIIGLLDGYSVARAVQFGYCLPAKKTPDSDPYGLGYRLVTPVGSLQLGIKRCLHATAEAIVTLGVLKRAFVDHGGLILESDLSTAKLLGVAGLSDIQHNSTAAMPHIKELNGCYYLPLTWLSLGSRQECYSYANDICNRLSTLPPKLRFNHSLFPHALMRLVYESLLNVFDHAYPFSPIEAAVSVSVVPASAFATDKRKGPENQWLSDVKSHGGLVLEVAVGDYGCGIPYRLWKNYKKHNDNQFLNLSKNVKNNSEWLKNRAKLQAQISEWALNHFSTSRAAEAFAHDAAHLNPRGLHQALNAMLTCSGCLILRSGQARTGYITSNDNAVTIPHDDGLAELPGVTVVGRFPNECAAAAFYDQKLDDSHEELILDTVIGMPNLPASVADLAPCRPAVKTHITGYDIICLPFITINHENGAGLNYLLRNLENHRLIGLASCNIPNIHLHQLCAYSADCVPSETPPRICTLFDCEGHGQYLIWGVLPEPARSIHIRLEREKTTKCTDPHECAFAQALANEYPNIITYDKTSGIVRVFQNISLNKTQAALVLQKSADALRIAKDDKQWIIEGRSNEFFRLSNGRTVKKLFSITLLMQEKPLLSKQLASRLLDRLKDIESSGRTCIIADTHSSFFLFHRLLGHRRFTVAMRIPAGTWTNVVVFSDAIYQGYTLRNCIDELGERATHVLVCFDLSEQGELSSLLRIKPEIMIKWPFNPEPTESANDAIITELDSITNLPRRSDPYAKFTLGDSKEAIQFLVNHAECFNFGLHSLHGRIHSVSINTQRIVQEHTTEICGWISDIITAWVSGSDPQRENNVLIVYRTGITISEKLPSLAMDVQEKLSRPEEHMRRVYLSQFDFAPERNRSIYPRATLKHVSIVANARQLISDDLFSTPLGPKYVIVYIDSAASSGRTLLNMLNEVCAYKEFPPMAVLAIPIVLGLSPHEERFLANCILTNSAISSSKVNTISFSMQPIFRLQVQTFDSIYATPVYEELVHLMEGEMLLDKPAKDYISKVRDRIGADIRDALPCCHPWYPEREPASSTSYLCAKIRHTVALLQQNEGGLEELRTLLLKAEESCDMHLLSIFAVEPALLRIDPLLHEFRKFAIMLAEQTIKSPDIAPLVISDAIAVLAQYPCDFVDLLYPLIDRCVNDQHLFNELSVFLVHLISKERGIEQKVLDILHEASLDHAHKTSGRNELVVRLQSMVRVNSARATWADKSMEDRILDVLRALYRHRRAYEELLDFRLYMTDGNLAKIVARKDSIIAFLQRIVQPAFLGIGEWCDQHNAPAEAEMACRSIFDFATKLDAFSQSVSCPSPDIEKVKAIWQSIMQLTFDTALQTALSSPSEFESSDVPMLQHLLTRCFCSPTELAKSVLMKRFPEVHLIVDESSEYGDLLTTESYLLVTAGGFDYLSQIMRQLVDNAGKYAIHESVTLCARLIQNGNGTNTLTLYLRNKINKVTKSPGKKGLPLIMELAGKAGWRFSAGPATDLAETWEATLVFPTVFIITPEPFVEKT